MKIELTLTEKIHLGKSLKEMSLTMTKLEKLGFPTIKRDIWAMLTTQEKEILKAGKAPDELVKIYSDPNFHQNKNPNRSPQGYIMNLTIARIKELIAKKMLEALSCKAELSGADKSKRYATKKSEINGKADLVVETPEGITYNIEVQSGRLKLKNDRYEDENKLKLKNHKIDYARTVDNYLMMFFKHDYNNPADIKIAILDIRNIHLYGEKRMNLYQIEDAGTSGYWLDVNQINWIDLDDFFMWTIEEMRDHCMEKWA